MRRQSGRIRQAFVYSDPSDNLLEREGRQARHALGRRQAEEARRREGQEEGLGEGTQGAWAEAVGALARVSLLARLGGFDELSLPEMAWATPHHSRTQVDAAGKDLVRLGTPATNSDFEETSAHFEHALAVINNWRASHSFPLNTFQVGLRSHAEQINPDALVAQRIKRLSSIELKLRRFPTMKLSQMQDLGCRSLDSTRREACEALQGRPGPETQARP